MVPLRELVRAVGDRALTVGIDVVVGARVHREVGRVAEAGGEVGLRLVQLDGEGFVIDDLQTLHLGLALLVAQDGLEEVGTEKRVLHGVVPRLDKILSSDGGSVGPLSVFQGDAVGLVALEFDGLRQLVVGFALTVVVHETGVNVIHDPAAAVLVGVARDKRVLRLDAASEDVVVTAATLSVV